MRDGEVNELYLIIQGVKIMVKLFWYIYFAIFLSIASISRIKVAYLRKRDSKAADLYAYKRVQSISNYVLKKSKTKVNIIGKENIPNEPCVFVSNHQAIFDAFLLLATIDSVTGFIAKKEIDKIPLIGKWMREIHTIYLDRSNIREGMKVIIEGAEHVKNGFNMVIFPEGTRSLSSEMGEFKKGSLKLALKAKAPVVPITIDGTYRVLEVGKKVRGHKITIMFHKPIYVQNLSKEEQKDISETVHAIVKGGLKGIVSS